MRSRISTLLFSALLVASPGFAQQHQPGQQPSAQGPMAMPMQDMAGMMTPGPAMILRMRGPLGLTDAQATQIEAARDRMAMELQPHVEAARSARMDAASILQSPTPDMPALEAALEDAANHEVQAELARSRGLLATRAVLTPDQRARLQLGMAMMHEMMGGMMEGMHSNMMSGDPPPAAAGPHH